MESTSSHHCYAKILYNNSDLLLSLSINRKAEPYLIHLNEILCLSTVVRERVSFGTAILFVSLAGARAHFINDLFTFWKTSNI